MTNVALVKAMARILFKTNPGANKVLEWDDAATPRGAYRKKARALIAAGYAVVPREGENDG